MTSGDETTPSLRMYKPLRGFKLSRQDLITLNELLQQLAREAATLETADYTKSEEETEEKFKADKKPLAEPV